VDGSLSSYICQLPAPGARDVDRVWPVRHVGSNGEHLVEMECGGLSRLNVAGHPGDPEDHARVGGNVNRSHLGERSPDLGANPVAKVASRVAGSGCAASSAGPGHTSTAASSSGGPSTAAGHSSAPGATSTTARAHGAHVNANKGQVPDHQRRDANLPAPGRPGAAGAAGTCTASTASTARSPGASEAAGTATAASGTATADAVKPSYEARDLQTKLLAVLAASPASDHTGLVRACSPGSAKEAPRGPTSRSTSRPTSRPAGRAATGHAATGHAALIRPTGPVLTGAAPAAHRSPGAPVGRSQNRDGDSSNGYTAKYVISHVALTPSCRFAAMVSITLRRRACHFQPFRLDCFGSVTKGASAT